MSETKIVLSDKELEMVNDSEWILTKQRIVQIIFELLESVVQDIDAIVLPNWEVLSQQPTSLPRIFKGENYRGLPYVTLDYPKLFNSEKTLTLRTMFWWGNFISVTLHAGAHYSEHLINKLRQSPNSHSDVYICVHENQWHHYFEADNYELVESISSAKFDELQKKSFIKLAYKINLAELNDLRTVLFKHYQMLAEIMA